jgi:hypothetical protein
MHFIPCGNQRNQIQKAQEKSIVHSLKELLTWKKTNTVFSTRGRCFAYLKISFHPLQVKTHSYRERHQLGHRIETAIGILFSLSPLDWR